MRWLRVLLAEARAEKLVRAMVRHGTFHCVGEEHCPQWTAISTLYDDALDRIKTAKG